MAAALVEQTYDALMQMILEKKYQPGDRLPSEMVLCDELKVSRNTLRAALNKLSVLGFTETRQGGGTYLRSVDSAVYLNFFVPATLTHNMDLLEIMQFRKGIEVEAARLAAENATEEDVAQLRVLFERCQQESKHDMGVFAADNTDFHFAIAKASHNMLYIKMMEIVSRMILPVMQEFLHAQGSDIDSTFYHGMVLQCVINHKPEEASFFMQRHMTLILDRVEAYVKAGNRSENGPDCDSSQKERTKNT